MPPIAYEGEPLPPDVLRRLQGAEEELIVDPASMNEEQRNRFFGGASEPPPAVRDSPERVRGTHQKDQLAYEKGVFSEIEEYGAKSELVTHTLVVLLIDTTGGRGPADLIKRALQDHKWVSRIEVITTYKL